MNQIPGLKLDAFINWAIDQEDTQEVFKIQQSLIEAPNRTEMIEVLRNTVMKNSEFMKLYEEKFNPPFPTISELEACPEGSFGKALAQHLVENNIQLDFAGLDTSTFYQKEMNPLTYLSARLIRTHDVYHVVLGLGTTPQEEYDLLSFQLAQFASPYHLVMLAAAHLHTAFYQPEMIGRFLSSMSRFHHIGKSANFFPGFPFDNHWKTSLEEVRKMLRVSLDF
jgi:ubiquinone biosynthesis protein COQ4